MEARRALSQEVGRETGEVTEFALSVAEGLSREPRRLDCRYLYDEHGSRLFESICEQPEYYLTRAEESILRRASEEIAAYTGPVNLLEFGSGNSMKTRILLNAYADKYGAAFYIPVDISKSILDKASVELSKEAPLAEVKPFHGTYDEAFHLFGSFAPMMFLFLGSNIGNMDNAESDGFWDKISASLIAGDFCLLGLDINENKDKLHFAYNDRAGYSAEFTRNLFRRMNRELGTLLDLEAIEHIAYYNPEHRQVEIFAKFNKNQRIEIADLKRSFEIGAGELIRTEVSRKFNINEVVPYLESFGLKTCRVFTGDNREFAVLLLRKS